MTAPVNLTEAEIQSGAQTVARSGIREIMDLAASLEDVIHLELGEPDFRTPEHVVEAVERALHPGLVKYTVSRGEAALRDLLAAKLRSSNAIAADADSVVVTNGGTNAVFASLMAVLAPGDGVLIPDPGWPAFAMIASRLGGRLLRYRLLPESSFEPDLEEARSRRPQTHASSSSTARRTRQALYCRGQPSKESLRSPRDTIS